MRGLQRVGWATAAAAAGATLSCNQFDNACNRLIRDYCDHQVKCGIHFDSLSCQEEADAELYCNPTTTLEEFEACEDDLDTLSCTQARGNSCIDILCDAEEGCKYSELNDCRTTTPNGENVPSDHCTGDTGARR